MGQADILKFLKKNQEKWFTSKELTEELKINNNCLNRCLKSLHKQGEVFKKEKSNYYSKLYFLWKLR